MADARTQNLYGLAAVFGSPEEVLQAAEAVHAAGYRRADAFSSFPIEGLAEALGASRTRLPLIVLIGAACGVGGGFFMLWYANVISYPWNIGGRPPNSWPAFIPITFELGVLCAALCSAIAMLAMNGLPMPYHPIFNLPGFELATGDRFYVLIEARDANFDLQITRGFLETLKPLLVAEVLK